MTDDLTDRGPAERSRISLTEPWEVRYWTKALGVTEERLRVVVELAGPVADDVREFLADC